MYFQYDFYDKEYFVKKYKMSFCEIYQSLYNLTSIEAAMAL